MIFEWDEAKRAANLSKHGVDFGRVREFDLETAQLMQDRRKNYGEVRWRATGLVGLRLHVLVFTRRSGNVRVISLRKANVWR